MRVTLLAGAGSIHTIRWANALADRGVEVCLISQHAPIEPLNDSVRLERFPHRGLIGYFLMVPGVRRILRGTRPDVVSAHYASGYGTTARLADYRPWVLSVWGSDVYDVPARSPLHRWWIRKNLEAADRVLSTSRCMAEQTRRIAPNARNIAVTPFGVDLERFLEGGSSPGSGEKSEIVIGTVKKLAPKYGVDTLVLAFAALLRRLERAAPALQGRVRLRIVGDGPEQGALERLAAEQGVSDRVTFVGRVPHEKVPSELRKIDIYAALSRRDSESFGVAIIEAGAAGCPVVVSDAGGLPEVVVDGETGVVVPRDDPEAAAYALERLVVDEELRRRMGAAGRRHVRSTFAWETCVETMMARLTEVAGSAMQPGGKGG